MINEKTSLENKVISFQENLIKEVEKFEELHFRQNEEIIRLETLNKILHIEIGECKERESVMFSMVKEASLIKEKEREGNRAKSHANRQHTEKGTPSLSSPSYKSMKESGIVGEINILSKKSRATRIEEEDTDAIEDREGLHSEALLKSKNRIYFDNLVFKNV